jgi:mRNA interferase RelE/StbE
MKKPGGWMTTTHKWLIAFSDEALKQLRQLPSNRRMAVFRSLRKLLRAENPLELPGVKKLKAAQDSYRIRVGDYRILFRLEVGDVYHLKRTYKGSIQIAAIKHRSRAYR